MTENPITVLVVDDLPRVRDAVTTLLTITGDVEVVGAAGDGREAVQRARELRPDVVIMDLEMPVMDGCAATEQIIAERLSAVIVLSMHADPASRARALAAGASAFIEKCDASEQLVPLLRATRNENGLDLPPILSPKGGGFLCRTPDGGFGNAAVSPSL